MDLSDSRNPPDWLLLHEGQDFLLVEAEVGHAVRLVDAATNFGQELVASNAATGGQACLLMDSSFYFFGQEDATLLRLQTVLAQELSHINGSFVEAHALKLVVILLKHLVELVALLTIKDVVRLNKHDVGAQLLANEARHASPNALHPSQVVGRLDHGLVADGHRAGSKLGPLLNLARGKEHVHIEVEPGARHNSFLFDVLHQGLNLRLQFFPLASILLKGNNFPQILF